MNWEIDLDYLLQQIYHCIHDIYGKFILHYKDNYEYAFVLFFSVIIVRKLIDLFFRDIFVNGHDSDDIFD